MLRATRPLLQLSRRLHRPLTSAAAAAPPPPPPPPPPPASKRPKPPASASAPAGAQSEATVDADDGRVFTILGTHLRAADHHPAVLAALDVGNATREQQRAARKRLVIDRFRRSPSDTGSPEVQIAILTDRIKDLTVHMLANRKDTPKKRSMNILVSQRRKLMQYLLRKSPQRYHDVVKELGLRPSTVFGKDVTLGAKKHATPILR